MDWGREHPLVRLWARWQSFGVGGVIWRAALLAALAYGVFIVRLMLEKPYFGDYRYLEGWYLWMGAALGK